MDGSFSPFCLKNTTLKNCFHRGWSPEVRKLAFKPLQIVYISLFPTPYQKLLLAEAGRVNLLLNALYIHSLRYPK